MCPPGTFVRSWDGRHNANGLYALAITCSDGTYLGSIAPKGWGEGNEVFTQYTSADGFRTINVTLTERQFSRSNSRPDSVMFVSGVVFTDRQGNVSEPFGKFNDSSALPNVTSCTADARIVGLTTRRVQPSNPLNLTGSIGSFGLLCAQVKGETGCEPLVASQQLIFVFHPLTCAVFVLMVPQTMMKLIVLTRCQPTPTPVHGGTTTSVHRVPSSHASLARQAPTSTASQRSAQGCGTSRLWECQVYVMTLLLPTLRLHLKGTLASM